MILSLNKAHAVLHHADNTLDTISIQDYHIKNQFRINNTAHSQISILRLVAIHGNTNKVHFTLALLGVRFQ